MIFLMGVYPKPFLSRMEPAVERFVAQVADKRMSLDERGGAERFAIIGESGPQDGATDGDPAGGAQGERPAGEAAGESPRDASTAVGGGK
jgi:hypothetical protein